MITKWAYRMADTWRTMNSLERGLSMAFTILPLYVLYCLGLAEILLIVLLLDISMILIVKNRGL